MCKLSIIIPIYQVEQYLPACLDSALLPGREDYEIIAVDDGSPDRSGVIAEDYARRYPGLIRVIHQENGGLGAARNTGIDAARGDFLLFLDSDDTLAPCAVEEILDELRQDCDILIFGCESVSEAGKTLSLQSGCARKGSFTLETYPGILTEAPSACTKLWRRRLFVENDLRFPPRLWFEDLATSPRLYLRAGTFRAVGKPWLRYLQRSGSITNAKDPSRNREIIQVLTMVEEDFRRQGQYDRYRAELELLAIQHQLLAATVRVNLMDPKSPLQRELLEDMNRRFPRWRENPYLPSLPAQHRLLIRLIDKGHSGAVHALMTANNKLKGK